MCVRHILGPCMGPCELWVWVHNKKGNESTATHQSEVGYECYKFLVCPPALGTAALKESYSIFSLTLAIVLDPLLNVWKFFPPLTLIFLLP